MRTIDPALQARLDSRATTLCRCWRVLRRDGLELGFTDHDEDVSFGGLVYRASSGMDASTLQSATGLSVDNAQALGALTSAAVRDEDIAAGKFDRAEIWHWLVDWEAPDLRVLMFRGHFGEIKRSDGAFQVELRGQAEALGAAVGRTVMRTCDRVLGDGRCRFDTGKAGFSGEGTVSRASAGTIVAAGLGGFSDRWFEHGSVTWLSGANVGTTGTVKLDGLSGGGLRRLSLWAMPGATVAAGDRFRVVAGCDKSADTCRAKFANFLNFRGFPHLPGDDWVTAYPKDGQINDGSSREQG